MSAPALEKRYASYRSLLERLKPADLGELYEDLTSDLYWAKLQPGSEAIDGGGNVGRHTVAMAECVGPTGKLFVFEPSPAVLPHLKQVIERSLYKNSIVLREVALSDKKGRVRFEVLHGALGMSGLKLRDDLSQEVREKVKFETVEVEADTLDAMIPARASISYIKLDLEGAEYHALLGGQRVVGSSRPWIVFENGREHTARLYGYQARDFFELFERMSYDIYDALGYPFGVGEWELGSVPWQFIALPRGDRDGLLNMRVVMREWAARSGISDLLADAPQVG